MKDGRAGPTGKLAVRYEGRYTITGKMNAITYRIGLPGSSRASTAFHVLALKLVVEGPLVEEGISSGSPPPPLEVDGRPVYRLRTLMDSRSRGPWRGRCTLADYCSGSFCLVHRCPEPLNILPVTPPVSVAIPQVSQYDPVLAMRDTAHPDPLPGVRDAVHPDPVPGVKDTIRTDPVPGIVDAASSIPVSIIVDAASSVPVSGIVDAASSVPVIDIVDVACPVTRSVPVALPPDLWPPLLTATPPPDPPPLIAAAPPLLLVVSAERLNDLTQASASKTKGRWTGTKMTTDTGMDKLTGTGTDTKECTDSIDKVLLPCMVLLIPAALGARQRRFASKALGRPLQSHWEKNFLGYIIQEGSVHMQPGPVLQQPDPRKPFVVEVDASDVGVGVVLSQHKEKEDKLYPIAYCSRKLSLPEKNYAVRDRELLAMKLSFEEWRHWLEGAQHPFKVITDHKIQTMKRLNSRQAWWSLLFSRFNFSNTYRSGERNLRVDALSR
ncbi:hypothetical protein P4O66_011373 [Electrophorus voltai]|uniref:Reverse transcriptase RNase H-like domain-containing protein n=1 Tax=Electrophorus voltai TaxID=2609070 RepID=A0AAD8YNI0_9TELE|nr:hypothetical protein P4O66_011373 [Electrophorus voltai]